MVKIGHAAKDERGRYSGGAAGDQTGREVYVRSWYNRPWSHVLRADDPGMAERIAVAMENACATPLIGYDQGQRNSLLSRVRTLGYNPGLVGSPCECDCSSLVSVCCMYAGVPETALYREGNCCTTSTLREALMRTGQFATLKATVYTNSPDRLMRGDILLYEGHHVAVALEDGGSYPVLRRGSFGPEVRRLQGELAARGHEIDVDGEFGPQTGRAVIAYQGAHALAVDEIVGPRTWRELRGAAKV